MMDLFIFIVGFFLLIGTIVWGIVSIIRKRFNVKKTTVLTVAGIILIIIGLSMPTSNKSIDTTADTNTDGEIEEENDLETEVAEEEKVEPESLKQNEEENTEPVSVETEQQERLSFGNKINELANNNASASEKYYKLERYMMGYAPTTNEIEQFKNDIIADYKSGTYLSELDNHERMLTNIFKAYLVEKHSEGPIKDFAFDYFQNLKYTYRGVDAVDSEAVKSNERQMNKALEKMQ